MCVWGDGTFLGVGWGVAVVVKNLGFIVILYFDALYPFGLILYNYAPLKCTSCQIGYDQGYKS